jgi:hypothetical protein
MDNISFSSNALMVESLDNFLHGGLVHNLELVGWARQNSCKHALHFVLL